MPENNDNSKSELVELDEDLGLPVCPKCGKVVDQFTHLGKQNYIKCPNGCRVGTTKISDELFDEFVDQIEVDHDDEPMASKVSLKPRTSPFPGIKTDAEILVEVLSNYEVSKKSQNMLLQRLDQDGILHTEQIVNVLTIFKECTKDVAPFIASEYQIALRNRDAEKQKLVDLTAHDPRMQPVPLQQSNPLGDAIELMRAMREFGVMGNDKSTNPELAQLKNEIGALKEQLTEAKERVLLDKLSGLESRLNDMATRTDGWKDDAFRLVAKSIDRVADMGEKGIIGRGQNAGVIMSKGLARISDPNIKPFEERPYMNEMSGGDEMLLEALNEEHRVNLDDDNIHHDQDPTKKKNMDGKVDLREAW